MSTTVRPERERPEADWDLVFKRNPVERIKRDKAPLGIRDELPALIAAGYEAVAEEDIVRLQWWGLYHDKPKIGTFMLRVKLPAGFVEPAKLRAIGEVSNRFGTWRRRARDTSERAAPPSGLGQPARRLRAPRRGGHHDRRRLRRHGSQHHGIAGAGHRSARALRLHRRDPGGGRFLLRQPRLLEPAAQAQVLDRGHARPRQRARDQLHRARGRLHEGQEGFGVLVGGGLSSVPRIAQELGVFVPKDEAVEVLAAITGAWAADLNYRVSRVKARLKFMIDDIGPEGMRERVEDRLGRKLADFDAAGAGARLARPPRRQRAEAARAQLHRRARAPRADLGRSDDRRRRHRRARRRRHPHHPAAELPRRQRAGRARVPASSPSSEGIGFSLAVNHVRGRSVGCTGEPHCNFSVTETKQRLGRLIEYLEARFGDAISSARPAARRLPARVRAALDRRSRLPGHDGARRRRQARAGVRHLRPRRPRRRTRRSARRCSGASRARSSTRRSQDSSRAGSTAAAGRTSRSPCSRAGRATRSWASRPGSSPSRDAYARRRNEHGAVR